MPKDQLQNNHSLFSIKEAAKLTGVSVSTLRNWERSGLIKPKRKDNNYRAFDFKDLELLKRIREYSQDKNLSHSIIKELLTQNEKHHSMESNSANIKYHSYHYEELKRYRKESGLTLEEVARVVDISPSYLSRIEQGKVNVSYEILDRLASYYGESTIRFFDAQTEKPVSEMVRHNKGQEVSFGLEGVRMEMLTTIKSQPFEVARFVIEPDCGDPKKHSHKSGHEYITVLSGQLKVILDESKEFILEEKDSINFESTRIHQWLNPGKEKAEIIWVHSYI